MMRIGVPKQACLCQTQHPRRQMSAHTLPSRHRSCGPDRLRSIRSALLLSSAASGAHQTREARPTGMPAAPDLVLDKVEGGLLKMRRTACRI